MPAFIRTYVRFVDAFNRRVGRVVMYGVLVLLAILLWAAFSKGVLGEAPIWTVEMAAFTLTSYYMLGGAYAMQNGAHVRMDLFYSRWTPRTRAFVDAVTVLGLLVYLGVLVFGAIESTIYAFATEQRRPSAWGPPLWPIRTIMTIGIGMMLAQALATLFKDIAVARGEPIE